MGESVRKVPERSVAVHLTSTECVRMVCHVPLVISVLDALTTPSAALMIMSVCLWTMYGLVLLIGLGWKH